MVKVSGGNADVFKRVGVSLLCLGGLLMQPIVHAGTAPHSAQTGVLQLAQLDGKEKQKKASKAKDKRVCKRQKVTGSRIAERVCRKQSEWDRISDKARENVETAREKSSRSTGADG